MTNRNNIKALFISLLAILTTYGAAKAALTVSYSDFTAGTTIMSDQVDTNFSDIVNYVNGTGWITTTHILDGTIRNDDVSTTYPITGSRVSVGGISGTADYITGFVPTYYDTNTIYLSKGACVINSLMNVSTSLITVNWSDIYGSDSTDTASTWYYIYLDSNASEYGTPTEKISSTPPADYTSTTEANARYHPSDSTMRFVCSVYNNSGQDFRQAKCTSMGGNCLRYDYDKQLTITDGVTPGTASTESVALALPSTSQLGIFGFTVYDAGGDPVGLTIGPDGGTLVTVGFGYEKTCGVITVPTDADQEVDMTSGSSDVTYLYGQGYFENR